MSTRATPSLPATTSRDLDHLPDEPTLLKRMLAEVLDQLRQSRQHSEQLQTRLDQLLRRLYGPRAERFNPNQLLLFPDGTTPSAEATLPLTTPPLVEPTPNTGKRKGHGRQSLPQHLPRDRRVYELSAVERACPCCGQERVAVGAETSEQLDYEPATLTVIEHVRLTYACSHCQAPRATPRPAPSVPSPAEDQGGWDTLRKQVGPRGPWGSASLRRRGRPADIHLQHGDQTASDLAALFGRAGFVGPRHCQ